MGITKEIIDNVRKENFRPGVVGVFVNEGRVLLLNKKEWELWLFPQGGISNNETTQEALAREMGEELGAGFVETWVSEPLLLFEDRIEFRRELYSGRKLTLDDGTEVEMLGKHYYYLVVATSTQDIAISDTEFDDYKWLTYEEVIELSSSIYQKNKRKALIKVLNLLLDKDFIK